jgi:hypothetical protein
MKTVGIVTTVVVAAVLLGGVVIGVRSAGDIRRYLKMRHM